jgi:hypothetical protein
MLDEGLINYVWKIEHLVFSVEVPMNFKAGILAGVALAIASGAAQAHVATISGGYDDGFYDTPLLIINNNTNYAFTNAQMVLTPYQPGTADYSTTPQTVNLGTFNANSNTRILFGVTLVLCSRPIGMTIGAIALQVTQLVFSHIRSVRWSETSR